MKNNFRLMASVASARNHNATTFKEEASLVGALILGIPVGYALARGVTAAWNAAGDFARRREAESDMKKKAHRSLYFANTWRQAPFTGKDYNGKGEKGAFFIRFTNISQKDDRRRMIQDGRRRFGAGGKGTKLDGGIKAQMASSRGPKPKYFVELDLSSVVSTADIDDNRLKKIMRDLVRAMKKKIEATKRAEKNKPKPALASVEEKFIEESMEPITAFVIAGLLGPAVGVLLNSARKWADKKESRRLAGFFTNRWQDAPVSYKGKKGNFFTKSGVGTDGKLTIIFSTAPLTDARVTTTKTFDIEHPIEDAAFANAFKKTALAFKQDLKKYDVDQGRLNKSGERNSFKAMPRGSGRAVARVEPMDLINVETALYVQEVDMVDQLSRFGSAHSVTQSEDEQEFFVLIGTGASRTSVRISINNNTVTYEALGRGFDFECRDVKIKQSYDITNNLSSFLYTLTAAGDELSDFVASLPSDKAALEHYIKSRLRQMPTVRSVRGKKGELNIVLHHVGLPDTTGKVIFSNRASLTRAISEMSKLRQ